MYSFLLQCIQINLVVYLIIICLVYKEVIGGVMEEKPLKIVFNGAAKNWTDALPIGNARLGAMIHGGLPYETINLNEDTLWTGMPGNYTNPNSPNALAIVRKLVDEGNYSEATSVADHLLSGSLSDVYQLLGDIKLEFDDNHSNYSEETYIRELDLDNSTVTVRYSVGEVEFTREHFASYPDQVIVTKISSSKQGFLSFNVYLDSKMRHTCSITTKHQIIMEGTCSSNRNRVDDTDGIRFTSVLDVQIGGDNWVLQKLDDIKLRVENATWATLLLVASSSFDGPFTLPSNSTRNPTLEALSMMDSVKTLPYSSLYSRHLSDYQELYRRVSLHLSRTNDESSRNGDDNTSIIPTFERVRSFQTDEDPSLIELLFQYGRYLLISSSRPGTQPTNLQGIWNKDITPPWDCSPHLNINLQMNYWLALSCNLEECQEPLFDFISSLAINGIKTANVNYEANGWVVHQVTDIWAKTSPDMGKALWALWPMGGAWLSTHLWEHYTYTMDTNFLENRAYPLLKGVASFLLDWLTQGKDGYLETNPSTSPEHEFEAPNGKVASVSYSSTMDMAIIKEVFDIVISASAVLGMTGDNLIIQRVVKARDELPPYKVAQDGSIMEWAQEFKDNDPHHRHVSHLYGIFPGHTITLEKHPNLTKAANYSLHKRGEDGPGWSTVWKIALWARLHSNDNSYKMVKHLFNLVDPTHESDFEGGLYSNLFSAHPPFQIDANFGFSAAVAEMLVQSSVNDIYLLPSLPKDKWPYGCVKGLRARGGLTVNICWGEGDLREVNIWSSNSNLVKIRLHYRGTIVTTRISSSKVYTFDRQLKCVNTYSLH